MSAEALSHDRKRDSHDGTANEVNSAHIHTRNSSDSHIPAVPEITEKQSPRRGYRFWMVFVSLCVTSLLSAIEGTAVSTVFPTISADLNVGINYVWLANAYFLTSVCFQPLFGQTANIFGRRWPTIFSAAIFTFGSGLTGGASNTAMFIAGRALQGIGGGGINMLIDLIVCDLVPLRQRGNYMGLIFAVFALGTSLGPFIGGAIASNTTWRWVFYLQLPIGGVAIVLLLLFLQVEYVREPSIKAKLRRVDFAGNALLVAAIVAILIALSWAGVKYPWSSASIIVPLVLGILGLVGFVLYEASPLCKEPTTPPRLFSNRTSLMAFMLTFIHGILTFWVIYILPLYFQGVLLSSPERSGVQLLPTVIVLLPATMIAGGLLAKFGKYKILHQIGAAIMTIGLGCFTLLDASSSTAVWAVLQAVVALGSGLLLSTLLPACQAGLPESDTAVVTGTWAFVRSFGGVWGLSIPAAIFNSRFDKLANHITDPQVRRIFSNGQGYSRASRDIIGPLPPGARNEVIGVYSDSLKFVWQISIAFAGLSFILACLEKQVELRTQLDTEFGLREKGKTSVTAAAV